MLGKKTTISSSVILRALVYMNVFMFFISMIFSKEHLNFSLNPLNFLTPSTKALEFLGATGKWIIDRDGTWWTLLTANWLHGGLLHLVFNMLALRVLVPLVIKEYGVSRMFTIYTLTGISGFLLSYFGHVTLTIGASSGICGLIGAALYFGKSSKGQWGRLVYKETTGWVISLVIFGFIIPNINNWSHAGGLISGILFGWMLGYNQKRRENYFDMLLAAALFVSTAWLLAANVIDGFLIIEF